MLVRCLLLGQSSLPLRAMPGQGGLGVPAMAASYECWLPSVLVARRVGAGLVLLALVLSCGELASTRLQPLFVARHDMAFRCRDLECFSVTANHSVTACLP